MKKELPTKTKQYLIKEETHMNKREKGIQYKMMPIKDTINEIPKQGFVPRIVSRGTITTRMVAKDIAAASSFSLGDVHGMICSLVEEINRNLQKGYNVTIDGLGTFSISAESRMVENENDIRANSIHVKRVTFRTARGFQARFKSATFQRMEKNQQGKK